MPPEHSSPAGNERRPDLYPWLDHLRRDRRGLPVPFVNLWGDVTVATTRFAHCPYVGREAAFYDDFGDTPNFTKMSIQRQRQCMVEGLCQVCGKPCPWSRRNLVVSGSSVEFVTLKGFGRKALPVVMEAWLCDRCAHIATRWCPALIRRRHGEDLTVVPVRSKRECQLIVSEGYYDGEQAEHHKANPVAMWVKIALLSVRIEPRHPVQV